MGKIEELIRQYCPYGVEYKPLSELAEIGTGSHNTQDAVKNGKYVFYVRSPEPLLLNEYDFDDVSVITAGDGVGVGKVFHLTNGKYALHQRAYRIHPLDDKTLDPKYVYYYFTNAFYEYIMMSKYEGSVASIRLPMLKRFEIPVPPLPIQKEIVRILDVYTELETELENKLETENELRQKQYEYYRDRILSLEDFEGEIVEAPLGIKEGGIADIYDGTHQTPRYTNNGVSFISVENIGDIYKSDKFISKEDYDKYKVKPCIGDVFMTRIGSIGSCAIMTKDVDLAYYVSLALIRPDRNVIDSRYLRHYIESIHGRKELYKRTLVNAVPIKVNKDDIGMVQIRFPKKLEDQRRIADLLDKFCLLTTNISESIPTEIKMYHQQYEYYRDRLFTFGNIKGE